MLADALKYLPLDYDARVVHYTCGWFKRLATETMSK